MDASLVGTELELDVGRVGHGGFCVARAEGRVVFVRHALPGERVRAVVTEGGPGDRFLRADAVEILKASADRVEPPCPYAGPGRCGGCDWQHATLDAQRRLKAAVVEEQLQRLARIERPVVVEAVPGDDDGLGWRTRVQFAVDDEGRLGLRRHRSHDVVAIERCHIASADIDQLGATARRWPGLRSVELASTGDGERMVVLRPVGAAGSVAVPELDAPASVVVEGRSSPVRGRSWLREHGAGRSWRVSADGFWQVHPGAVDVIVAAVLDGLEPAAGESALDLYSGVGLFAGALAGPLGPAGHVVAVESDPRAVADARRNLHDLPSVRIVAGRVERAVSRLGLPAVDLVVLDPPRTGAGRVVSEAVAALRPRRIAYVACDPAALARDIATFSGLGYALMALRAFDIFPMTAHVECVAVLGPG